MVCKLGCSCHLCSRPVAARLLFPFWIYAHTKPPTIHFKVACSSSSLFDRHIALHTISGIMRIPDAAFVWCIIGRGAEPSIYSFQHPCHKAVWPGLKTCVQASLQAVCKQHVLIR